MNHDGGERSGYTPLPSFGGCVGFFWLHDLGHKVTHGFCCLILDLSGGVGVGTEGEACVVVAQHTADSFHVYAILEGYCGEGVPEAMERNVFKISVPENLLVELRYGIWMVHLSGGWRGEHILVVRMLVMFLDQEVYRFLRDGYSADGGFSLGSGKRQFSVGVPDVLLADKDRAVLYIQVRPEKSNQFAFAESADQRQIKHREESSGICCIQVGFHIIRVECLSLELLDLGGDAVIGRVTRNQPLFDCPLKGTVEHEVDAANGGAAQAGTLILSYMDAPIFHEVLVELLEVAGGEFGELDFADSGDGIGLILIPNKKYKIGRSMI